MVGLSKILEMKVKHLKSLLTPKEILNRKDYDEPYFILEEDFKNFGDLLKYRTRIRDLELVPLKSVEMQQKYHSFDKDELINGIDFGDSNILFMENQFPYVLPSDVSQNIIWIKTGASENAVISFLINKIKQLGIKDIILFERPVNIQTKFVKGSFPFIRHIHFWHGNTKNIVRL